MTFFFTSILPRILAAKQIVSSIPHCVRPEWRLQNRQHCLYGIKGKGSVASTLLSSPTPLHYYASILSLMILQYIVQQK